MRRTRGAEWQTRRARSQGYHRRDHHDVVSSSVEIGEGETYWFAVANAPPRARDVSNIDDSRAEVAKRFGSWPLEIGELIAATPRDRVFRTDIHDRDPIASFHRGRVVLLGDAAHPTTPDLGQGGCLAVEDAIVLAKCLAESKSYEDAFKTYDENASRAHARSCSPRVSSARSASSKTGFSFGCAISRSA